MSDLSHKTCPWALRVSALLDHELPQPEEQMVLLHARSCSACSVLILNEPHIATDQQIATYPTLNLALSVPVRMTPLLRGILALVGLLIVIGSASGFVRGNTSGDVLHDLRHLSIWQASIGVAMLSAAISFRISRLLAVMMVTLIALTLVSTVYDIVTGHKGPWTDPLHLIETVAVVVILWLIFPQARLRATTSAK